MYMLIRSPQCRALYCTVIGVLSVLLFLCSFFPMKKHDVSAATKDDLPTSIRNLRLNVSHLYEPTVSRLIIIVIDALRHDFVADAGRIDSMPYTASLIEMGKACLLTARANPPTVTMPRIKALTTGTVPNFIDVALNFGSSRILEDNIILQAESHGLNVVFYGDDTWLKLFPNSFIRKEGTTSFFVSDFYEVDNNVTRHLSKELMSSDWHIMILHYLGLDHIGHIEGPKGSHIQPKLQEMDSVIKWLHQELMNSNYSAPPAIVICGDHGMKDSGGHGGASLAEILVPFVVTGHSCVLYLSSNVYRTDAVVAQIDLVPTLSVLLGLPIPRSNLGKLILGLLSHLSEEQKLYALYYNTKQVARQYESNVVTASQGGLLEFEEAVRLHKKWLTSHLATDPDEIMTLYTSSLETMSSRLADSLVTYDMFSMTVAICILWQVCYILLLTPQSVSWTPTVKSALVEIVLLCILFLSANGLYCSYTNCQSLLCTKTVSSVIVSLSAALNTHIIMNFYHPRAVRQVLWYTNFHTEILLLVLGSGLQIASLGATSLIEEEHQVWYFLWTSLSLISVYKLITSPSRTTVVYQAVANLVLHRLLRKWNQTGDKWASLPDIGDWLVQPENSFYLSITLFVGLAGVLWSIHILNEDKSIHMLDKALYVLGILCVYGYRTATGSVVLPFAYPQSRGFTEVHVFWCTFMILLGRLMFKANVGSIVSCWLLLCALLHRPHNVVLLAAQVWTSRLLHGDITYLTIAHVWLGMVFYFYQGNSNSLASIDVASGYVGHEGYNPVTVGLLLLVNTYSAPVLSYLLLLTHSAQQQKGFSLLEALDMLLAENLDGDIFVEPPYVNVLTDEGSWLGAVCLVLARMRLLSVSVFAGLVMSQRYHLFVWTVFSPKLLYESVHTGVLLVVLIATNIVTQLLRTKGIP
ncbi:GPI ethanolamine phosphate transferase 2 [Anabrus simplex]|uniref:GPI ethanolamine phosphate transferase 2 n=1 Tax=Anabrus simplex TaxID=316456 RepID=UPI0035A30CCA